MENYDPRNYRRSNGDVFVAWLLFAVLMISALMVPLVDKITSQDQRDDIAEEINLGRLMQRNIPLQAKMGLRRGNTKNRFTIADQRAGAPP